MSLININPPACATVEKKPWRTRAASNERKLVAAADHAAVKNAKMANQNRTGKRPKYADRATTTIPPAPSMNRFPTRASLTTVSGRFHVLKTIKLRQKISNKKELLRLNEIRNCTDGACVIRKESSDCDDK